MKRILLLNCVVLLAACASGSDPVEGVSGGYDNGVPVVTESGSFAVYYAPPHRPYHTIGFVSLAGERDLLPQLRQLALGRGANAAVITSQQTERVGQNVSTFTLGLTTPFFALPTYANTENRDVYVKKVGALLIKL